LIPSKEIKQGFVVVDLVFGSWPAFAFPILFLVAYSINHTSKLESVTRLPRQTATTTTAAAACMGFGGRGDPILGTLAG